MGNCLKSPTSDDISLLHESQSDRASYGDGTEPDQEPPPPYQEQVPVPVYHPTPSQTRLATQLTEEEQIRIAQRIGLIQHLPKGVYDPGRDGSEKKIREDTENRTMHLFVVPSINISLENVCLLIPAPQPRKQNSKSILPRKRLEERNIQEKYYTSIQNSCHIPI
ncbi:RING finger protein 11 isoform X1 [Podarcis raffonei]|uniref:RING finger protein 11 isoform X1 n=1 Tax=Podarcis raffonei TaxID=65483 RepID=UPI0023293F1C|nr:RING finger protein 11 isoform X1 [Podarcis raffonei]